MGAVSGFTLTSLVILAFAGSFTAILIDDWRFLSSIKRFLGCVSNLLFIAVALTLMTMHLEIQGYLANMTDFNELMVGLNIVGHITVFGVTWAVTHDRRVAKMNQNLRTRLLSAQIEFGV